MLFGAGRCDAPQATQKTTGSTSPASPTHADRRGEGDGRRNVMSSDSPATTTVRLTREANGVAVITISRPPVNVLNWELKRALVSILEEIRDDEEINAIVFASDLPKVFCAGSDLFELSKDHDRPGSASERTRFEFEMWQLLSNLRQPSVAAVEGHALGSGMELCVACDFRIAGEGASFGLPEIKIGGGPGVQTLARLSLMAGLNAARRMLLLGESLTATEAYRVNIVDEVVPHGQALHRAMELATRLAAQPTSSMAFLRTSLSAAMVPALEMVEPVVMDGVEELFLAPQMHEGIMAFLEKRPPDFEAAAAAARSKAGR
jgi:enoyl-CoA hydratase